MNQREEVQRIREQFEKDVAKHELLVRHENGAYRHLYFGAPGTNCDSFSVVTWPGHLALTGDRGDYLFRRENDMVQFFRKLDNGGGAPNLRYWAEKCVAGATKEYAPKAMQYQIACQQRRALIEYSSCLDAAGRQHLWDAYEDLKRECGYSQEEAFCAVSQWRYDEDDITLRVDTAELGDCKQHTYGFVWAYYGLRRALSLYTQLPESLA